MDVLGKDEDNVLRKSEKKMLKRNNENKALSFSEVPTEEKKKKHKKSKEMEALRSSEVPKEKKKKKKKKHKKNKDKEALSSSEVSTEVRGVWGERKWVTKCSDVECPTDQAASKRKDQIDMSGEGNKGKGKKKKKIKERKNENRVESGESCIEKSGGEAQSGSRFSKKRNREEELL